MIKVKLKKGMLGLLLTLTFLMQITFVNSAWQGTGSTTQTITEIVNVGENEYTTVVDKDLWNRNAEINFEDGWNSDVNLTDYIKFDSGNMPDTIDIVSGNDLDSDGNTKKSRMLKVSNGADRSIMLISPIADTYKSDVNIEISMVFLANNTNFEKIFFLMRDSASQYVRMDLYKTGGSTAQFVLIDKSDGTTTTETYTGITVDWSKPIWMSMVVDNENQSMKCEFSNVDNMASKDTRYMVLDDNFNGDTSAESFLYIYDDNEDFYICAMDSNYLIHPNEDVEMIDIAEQTIDEGYTPERILEFYKSSNEEYYETAEYENYFTDLDYSVGSGWSRTWEQTSVVNNIVNETTIDMNQNSSEYQAHNGVWNIAVDSDRKYWENGSLKEGYLQWENNGVEDFTDWDLTANSGIEIGNEALVDEHKNVINITDGSSSQYASCAKDIDESSEFEFWFRISDQTKKSTIYLYDGGNLVVVIRYDSFYLKSEDLVIGTQNFKLLGQDTWCLIRGKVNEQLNTIEYWTNGDYEGEYPLYGTYVDGLDRIRFLSDNTQTGYEVFVDGISVNDYWRSSNLQECYNYTATDISFNKTTIGDIDYNVIVDESASYAGNRWYYFKDKQNYNISVEFDIQETTDEIDINFYNGYMKDFYVYTDGSANIYYWAGSAIDTGHNIQTGTVIFDFIISKDTFTVWVKYGSYSKQRIISNIEKDHHMEETLSMRINTDETATNDIWIASVKCSEATPVKSRYSSIGALKFESSIVNNTQLLNFTDGELGDFDSNWMIGVVVNNPNDYWRVAINFTNYQYGIDFHNNSFTPYYIWNDGSYTNRTALKEYHEPIGEKLYIDESIHILIGQYSDNIMLGAQVGHRYEFWDTHVIDEPSWDTQEPQIIIQNNNSVGNANLTSDLLLSGVYFHDNPLWNNEDLLVRIFPEIGKKLVLLNTDLNDYTLTKPTYSIAYDYWWNQIEEFTIAQTYNNGTESNLITSYEFPRETNSTTNTESKDFIGVGSWELGEGVFDYNQTEIFTVDISKSYIIYGESSENYTSTIVFSIDWIVWFDIPQENLFDTMLGFLVPIAILSIFPFAFRQAFKSAGVIVGLCFGFIVIGVSGMIPTSAMIICVIGTIITGYFYYSNRGQEVSE